MKNRLTRYAVVAAVAGAGALGLAALPAVTATSTTAVVDVAAWPDPDDPGWKDLKGQAEINCHPSDGGGNDC